jgi:N-acetylglucosamine-6-phosphate deacetylase
MTRTLLAGADIVLPDRVVSGHTLVLEGERIVEVTAAGRSAGAGETRVDLSGALIVPGFIDVHVHGVAGIDVLDGPSSVLDVARQLPRWGVTAFCPTTIACEPAALSVCLAGVGRQRTDPAPGCARVLPAHLESNFINPEYRGAQPLTCLRSAGASGWSAAVIARSPGSSDPGPFTGADILAVIDRHRADIGIVTLAPEIDGGLELVRRFAGAGLRVAVGHSGATHDEAIAAIGAGARHATHLFNRMRPMTHRDPGVVGAILSSDDVAAEIICDGHHVHPAVVQIAVAAKGAARVMAITDGTAGSGLPAGARARLGGQEIVAGEVARLEDGTIAGSVLTMDRAFACLVGRCGIDVVRAAAMCSTTPARELGLEGLGLIAEGAWADLTILDANLRILATWIGGRQIWPEP